MNLSKHIPILIMKKSAKLHKFDSKQVVEKEDNIVLHILKIADYYTIRQSESIQIPKWSHFISSAK